jgi:hypothetical protein
MAPALSIAQKPGSTQKRKQNRFRKLNTAAALTDLKETP